MMGVDGDKQNQLMYINQHLYSPFGRRSIDPVLLIKMLLIGYLFGIPSERRLEQEIIVNLAYRWFLGLDLGESIPDHSTLSQNRRQRFKDSEAFQEIFDHIVSACISQSIVTGEVVLVDSTHIKANASIGKAENVRVKKKPSEYFKDLEQETRRIESELQKDPNKKKRRKKPKEDGSVKEVKQIRS
ncbi:transposase [Paenibacillus sp. FSL H7-0331]|uniref:transposase n=1 Tax=Paenibacillus sp. FSL H7-0331 TaxID=1920421 RepID=UPI00096C67FE|nr:hypothetical protein BK127_41765 [Paenibacillus sp. FSL H7-0331]